MISYVPIYLGRKKINKYTVVTQYPERDKEEKITNRDYVHGNDNSSNSIYLYNTRNKVTIVII